VRERERERERERAREREREKDTQRVIGGRCERCGLHRRGGCGDGGVMACFT